MSIKIRCNDEVMVKTGKYKGLRGKVIKILHKGKAYVEGVNKATRKKGFNIFYKEIPIDISNLAIYNSLSNKADRVCFKIKNGKKTRVFKSDGNII